MMQMANTASFDKFSMLPFLVLAFMVIRVVNVFDLSLI